MKTSRRRRVKTIIGKKIRNINWQLDVNLKRSRMVQRRGRQMMRFKMVPRRPEEEEFGRNLKLKFSRSG